MRSSGNGPFGVLLLAAPLVAVPLLAIFGIPQFAPGVDAGSLTEHAEVGFDDDLSDARPSKSRRRSSDDLFDPLQETSGDDLFADQTETDSSAADSDDWEPPAEALKGYRMAQPEEQFADASNSEEWFEKSSELENGDSDEFDRGLSRQGLKDRNLAQEEVDYDRPQSQRHRGSRDLDSVNPPRELSFEDDDVKLAKHESFDDSPNRSGKDDSVVVEEFSWRQASRRLRELGDNVKHYFDYDIEKETYSFHCELSPLDDPGVVQEFQAQGHEPLTTVREVIKQVERWSRNRQANLAKSEKQSSDRSH